jgi:hypothetical protein
LVRSVICICSISFYSITRARYFRIGKVLSLIDKDGYITNAELFHVLKMMVGNNLLDEQLQQVVDKTILYSDKDGDQRISFKEFCDAIGPSLREDIINHLNKITSDDK